MIKLIKKIFGKHDRFTFTEDKLEAYYPNKLKKIISNVEVDQVIFQLPDQEFNLLPCFLMDGEHDEFNDPIKISEFIAKNCFGGRLKSEFVCLPFARSNRGDKYIYLTFVAYKNKPTYGEIYIADIDSNNEPIKYTNELSFLLGESIITKDRTVIKFSNLNFVQLSNSFVLNKKISSNAREDLGYRLFESESDKDSVDFEISAKVVDNEFVIINYFIQFNHDRKRLSFNTEYMVTEKGFHDRVIHKPSHNNFNDISFPIRLNGFVDSIRQLKQQQKGNRDISQIIDACSNQISLEKIADHFFIQIDYVSTE